MNGPYEVSYARQGHIQLRVPVAKSQANMAQGLDEHLKQQLGINGVRIYPTSGHVIISYNPLCLTNKSIMQMVGQQLNGFTAPATTQPPVFHCTEVSHAVKGRVRLRVPAIKYQDAHAAALEKYLKGQPGISAVRINQACANVIVHYDPDRWSGKKLVQQIEAFRPNQRQLTAIEPKDGAARLELQAALLTLGMALFGGPVGVSIAQFILLFSARSIFIRAYHGILYKHRLTVDSLDASVVLLLFSQGLIYQSAIMTTLVTLSENIRNNTVEKSRKAITEVLDYMSVEAWVVRNGEKVLLPIDQVQIGDVVVVYPGERIPVDGLVISGQAFVDQHALTGESMPVEKTQGHPVFAATAVREGKIYLETIGIGEDTQVARIVHMIQEAPIRDTRAQNYAEQFAQRIVPFSFLGGGFLMAIGQMNNAIAFMVFDYGAGLRVSAPTTVLSAMGKAARNGILIRGGRHLEKLAEVNAIIFDKTGTLTKGEPKVVQILPYNQHHSANEILALAAAAEQRLTHPVAQAVVEAAKERALVIPDRSESTYEIGLGVEAVVDSRRVLVGSQRYLEQHGVRFSQRAQGHLAQIEGRAASPLCVAVEGQLIGVMGLADPIRPESAEVIRQLREEGVKEIVMLTGDREAVAREVAGSLGITNYVAEVFPGAKLEAVKQLQAQGYTVAVVGDGINDSPALAQADVGIAVSGGTAVAQEAADVVLLKGDLRKVLVAIEVAKEGMKIIRQNWKIIGIPNGLGMTAAFFGYMIPATATLVSDGAAITAGFNSVRPMVGFKKQEEPLKLPANIIELSDPADDLAQTKGKVKGPVNSNGKALPQVEADVLSLTSQTPRNGKQKGANGSAGTPE